MGRHQCRGQLWLSVFSILFGCFCGANAASSLFDGCASLQFPAAPECFVDNQEILPSMHIAGGLLRNVSDARECQSKCVSSSECSYFTFRKERATGEATCHLRPCLSYAASPVMVGRKFDASSRYVYTSGPKRCGQKCEELKEVVEGCSASSPSSCALIGNATFDGDCAAAANTTKGCGKSGYRCCKDCRQVDCPNARKTDVRLDAGTQLTSFWNGTESPEHCHTLCLITPACTHWNFIISNITRFLGGACYLKTYNPVTAPVLIPAEDDITSVVGAVSTSRDFGLGIHATAADRNEVEITAKPTEETQSSHRCFEPGVMDELSYAIANRYEVKTAEQCQSICKSMLGCRFFFFNPSTMVCRLKYAASTAPAGSCFECVVGPRDCPGDGNATSHGCVSMDTEIAGADIGGSGVHSIPANQCAYQCQWKSDCKAWMHKGKECYWKSEVGKSVEAKNVISGQKYCYPSASEEWRRRLEAGGLFTQEKCVRENSDYKGGDLDVIQGVLSVESCHDICMEREDCKIFTYEPATELCRVKWGGEPIERLGVFSMSRACVAECSEDKCPLTAASANPVLGLATKDLGFLDEWGVRGNVVDFSRPSLWRRFTMVVASDDEDEECYVSDLVASEQSCWQKRHRYLPLHMRAQIIGVAAGRTFPGWAAIPWEKKEAIQEPWLVELLNEEIEILETNKTNSERGVFLLPIASTPIPDSWPSDMTTPEDFSGGRFYARYQALSTPVPTSFRIMFCITASDYPVSESCTPSVVVPPFDA